MIIRAHTGEHRLKSVLLGEGLEEEGEHAVARDVGERRKFQRVVAAVEFEGAGVGAVAAEGVEHLTGEFGEHGGVVLAVDEKAVAARAHAAFDIGQGADGGPVFAELVDGDVVAQAFPDVIGGHAVADDVGVIGGDVEEAAGADGRVVDESDVANRGAETGAENAEFGEALLLEPAEAAAGVLDGLAVGLEGEADVGAADLVGALVAGGHAAVMIGHAHFEDGDSQALNPAAEAILAVPFGVPVGEDEDGGTRTGRLASRKELCVDGVVFGPRRFDGAGEGEDVFAVQAVVGGGGRGEPVGAVFDGVSGALTDEGAGLRAVGRAANVLEAPVEGLDATVVVGGPAAVLVAADFAFKPVHEKTTADSLQSSLGEEKGGSGRKGRKRVFQRGAHPDRAGAEAEHREPRMNVALGMRHEGGGVC